MKRRPNYGAEKRTRELKRNAKREAKLARRQSRAAMPVSQPDRPPDPNLVPEPSLNEQDPTPPTHQET